MARHAGDTSYDIAVSFLYRDESTALALDNSLSAEFNLFVYSRAQERVEGKDGYEAFSSIFRNNSRLVVVLHRREWGTTPFTSVEEEAIKARHYEGAYKWDFLLLVKMDDAIAPEYIPPYKIYHSRKGSDIETLASVVANRAIEYGARARPVDAISIAEDIGQAHQRADEDELFFRSAAGKHTVDQSVHEIFTSMQAKVERIRTIPGLHDLRLETDQGTSRLTSDDLGFLIRYGQTPRDPNGHCLTVGKYDGPFPTDIRGNLVRDVPNPRKRAEDRYYIVRDDSRVVMWRAGRSSDIFSEHDLADYVLKGFLEAKKRLRR